VIPEELKAYSAGLKRALRPLLIKSGCSSQTVDQGSQLNCAPRSCNHFLAPKPWARDQVSAFVFPAGLFSSTAVALNSMRRRPIRPLC